MSMMLLPPAPNVCQKCAVDHKPHEAHNQQSMYWQYWFNEKYNRWPTWADAIAHLDKDSQDFWLQKLEEFGITVNMDNAINVEKD